MDKKEYLQKILTQLEPIRDLARGLKILVDEGNLADDVLDVLINAVQGAVSAAKSEVDKLRLQKGLDALKKMKEMEAESLEKDDKNLKSLDKMLENI